MRLLAAVVVALVVAAPAQGGATPSGSSRGRTPTPSPRGSTAASRREHLALGALTVTAEEAPARVDGVAWVERLDARGGSPSRRPTRSTRASGTSSTCARSPPGRSSRPSRARSSP